MSRIFNQPEGTDLRRILRKQLAPAEALLWTRLSGRQLLGQKFRRQYGVGAYVVDFYCPALKLAIEVDGNTHIGEDAELRDAARQAWIEQYGVTFLRFVDTEVLRSVDAVLEHIAAVVEELCVTTTTEGDLP